MKFELEPNNRNASDEVLIADLKRVSRLLGKSVLTRSEYDEHGRFSYATLSRRFGSWQKALRVAGVQSTLQLNVSDSDLLRDLTAVAQALSKKTLSGREYDRHGKFTSSTFSKRFGSWNAALTHVGLDVERLQNVSEEELFSNLEEVWRKLGRQPRMADFARPFSKYSVGPYVDRFGSFRKALERFTALVNKETTVDQEVEEPVVGADMVEGQSSTIDKPCRHKTKRDPNWRLRFLVLRRDNYKCVACGASPATQAGVQLRLDHIVPWERCGETVLENLQVLCEPCNNGKSNLDFLNPPAK